MIDNQAVWSNRSAAAKAFLNTGRGMTVQVAKNEKKVKPSNDKLVKVAMLSYQGDPKTNFGSKYSSLQSWKNAVNFGKFPKREEGVGFPSHNVWKTIYALQ